MFDQKDAVKLNQLYIKLISIKLSCDDFNIQSQNILNTLQIVEFVDIYYFEYQLLLGLFSKEIMDDLFTLILNYERSELNLSILSVFCSYHDHTERKEEILTTLLEIIKASLSIEKIYKLLQLIANKHPNVMIKLDGVKLLESIVNTPTENPTLLEKSILLCIQSLTNITAEVLIIIHKFSTHSDTYDLSASEMFLKLISACSVDAHLKLDILQSASLWGPILSNLVSSQPIHRKRAMYWLNRLLNGLLSEKIELLSVLLPGNEELSLPLKNAVVADILLLIDCLEEKQTHVITPSLPKIENLKKCYSNRSLSIHWLLIVIEKASLHESTLILKWAFSEFLNLPVRLSLASYRDLLSSFFLKTLNNSNLYFSPDSVDDRRGFFATDALSAFLTQLFNEFSTDSHHRMLQFLDSLSAISWNSQALLFFAESFSSIRCRFSLPMDVFSRLARLCSSNLSTFDGKYRQCISSFLISAFLHNHSPIDIETVPDFLGVLHRSFDISRTIFPDSDLMALLQSKFDELSTEKIETAFFSIVKIFEKIDFSSNFSNFTATANKISAISMLISIFFRKIAANRVADFLANVTESIHKSSIDFHSNRGEIMKSIILLKQLHYVRSHNREKSIHIETESDFITESMRFLSAEIDAAGTDKQCQRNCLDVMRYFVKNFPDKMIQICHSNDHHSNNKNSPMRIIIAANIDQSYRDRLPTEDFDCINWLSDDHRSLLPIDYEKFNLLSQSIDCVLSDHFEGAERIFSIYFELLDVSSSGESLTAVLNLIGQSIRACPPSCTDIVPRLVTAAWSRLLEFLSNAQRFWRIYSVFLSQIVNSLQFRAHHTIAIDDTQSKLIDSLRNLTKSIFEIGENKFGMVHMLGDSVHNFVLSQQLSLHGSGSDLSDFYVDLICALATFGPCHRRSLRFENKIDRYLSTTYTNRWSPPIVQKLAESSDRVAGLLLLSISDASVLSPQLRERIIVGLRHIDSELLSTSTNCYKNYINNRLHRSRHRVFSALLVSIRIGLETLSMGCCDSLESWMLSCIENETLSSVRHLAEWNLILMYDRDRTKQHKLVSRLQSMNDTKPAYVCSLITICRHLIESNRSQNETAPLSSDFIEQAVLAILPLASAQNYNVRLHSASFLHIVHESRMISSGIPHLATVIGSFVAFIGRAGTGRNIGKLSDNFWWNTFRPLEDVCFETVFAILPRLFELVDEEIITIDQFRMVGKSTDRYGIGFENARSVWEGCRDTAWRVKTVTDNNDNKRNGNENGSGIVDVQKKIQPWLTSRPDEELLRDLVAGVAIQESGDMVLVCSLLDKPTNVGGLARTSNIFGVGEFVVDNLRVVDDNSFKQLAVTADKWINMTEVPVKSLISFINVKRADGFEIVGIEQTANSVALQSTVFERKTVLILGNEKEGIPAELISHLDRCIEIPQLGQIRSLNVHVTGALVLWEYVKQIKLTNKTK